MKKIIIMITLTLLLTGCNKLEINNNITSITYNNHTIDENDYGNILNYLNRTTFYCGKKQDYNDRSLVINTNEEIFNFHLSNNYYMEYQKDNKYCYTKNKELVKNLITTLDNLINKYTNINVYNVFYAKDYKENDEDFNIRLDKSNDYIVINTDENISNFKINEIEYIEDNYAEVDLIYSEEVIDKNNIVIRKNLTDNCNIKISFTNSYGYVVNIIPLLKDNISFNIEIK